MRISATKCLALPFRFEGYNVTIVSNDLHTKRLGTAGPLEFANVNLKGA
jgi:hypothetical protein